MHKSSSKRRLLDGALMLKCGLIQGVIIGVIKYFRCRNYEKKT